MRCHGAHLPASQHVFVFDPCSCMQSELACMPLLRRLVGHEVHCDMRVACRTCRWTIGAQSYATVTA